MSSMITLVANATTARLINAPNSAKTAISDLLSYAVEGSEFMFATQNLGWNGRSTFYSAVNDTFPAGFAHMVHDELIRLGFGVSTAKRPAPPPLGSENPIVDAFGNDDPRYDFQLRALRSVERHKRGIIQVATGGGKSKIAKLIMARFQRMTLFITTRGVLMYQMKKQIEKDMKRSVGVIGDGEWTPRSGINVGMVQTLIESLRDPDIAEERRFLIDRAKKRGEKLTEKVLKEEAKKRVESKVKRRARTIKLLEMVEVVIGEEAHEVGGNSYFEILRHCKNAEIRIALTATPFMRTNAESNMRLMGAFGPILIKVSEELLINRGILAKPYFMFASPAPNPKLAKSSPWERAYKLEIIDGEGRNQRIRDLVIKSKSYNLPSLVLIQRKDHGANLEKMFTAAGVKTWFLSGKDSQEERDAGLEALAAGKIDALIGSTILDVGVDVPSLGMVILAGGGKAEVALRQRVGRGLRAKKSGANVTFIVDFTDDKNTKLREHAKQRRAIIESTPGFKEGILSSGKDFPWELHAVQKVA